MKERGSEMKITIVDGRSVNPGDLSWDVLNKYGEVIIYDDKVDEDEVIKRIGDSDIAVVCKCKIGRKTFEACKNLKMIAEIATGYDNIDVEAAKEYGIVVSNIPHYATYAVAQFVIGLILELCHRIGDHDKSVHNGDWIRSKDFSYWNTPQVELFGKTLGIIGYGNIGKVVGEIATALGMKVIYNSPHAEGSVSLDELFQESDIISINTRLNSETREMINKDTISKMKDGVWIVNTSRGLTINEEDLMEALNSGKVGAAALDVVSVEPMKKDNPLLKAKNCIITPHMAWSMKECRQRIIDITDENIDGFLKGKPVNTVTK